MREIFSISGIDLHDLENFMDTQDICLGVLKKIMVKMFLGNDGDISQKQLEDFHDTTHYYFKSAFEYIQTKFLWTIL